MDFSGFTDQEVLEKAVPKTFREKLFLRTLERKLGEITTVQEISDYLKISKATVYRGIDENKLLTFKMEKKILVLTKTILNAVRSNNIYEA